MREAMFHGLQQSAPPARAQVTESERAADWGGVDQILIGPIDELDSIEPVLPLPFLFAEISPPPEMLRDLSRRMQEMIDHTGLDADDGETDSIGQRQWLAYYA